MPEPPKCYTCGLTPSRGSCPVIVSTSPASLFDPLADAFDPKTFKPWDVRIGCFTYGIRGGFDGQPRMWWNDVALDRLVPAYDADKPHLAAHAVLMGHKVLRSATKPALRDIATVYGPHRAAMRRFCFALRHEYERRAAAARLASGAAAPDISVEELSIASRRDAPAERAAIVSPRPATAWDGADGA